MENAMTNATKTARDTLTSVTWQHDGTALVSVKGYPTLMFNPQQASLLNRNRAAQFGWDNRFKNKTSVSADPATGRVDTAEKYRLACALRDFYHQGGDEWDMRSAGGGGGQGGADAGLVLQALMNVKGWTLDTCNAKVQLMAEAKSVERKDVLASLAKLPTIILEVASIKAKRAAAGALDAGSMLDEMDKMEEEDDNYNNNNNDVDALSEESPDDDDSPT